MERHDNPAFSAPLSAWKTSKSSTAGRGLQILEHLLQGLDFESGGGLAQNIL
jgi:flagellin-specific chaperone FliS